MSEKELSVYKLTNADVKKYFLYHVTESTYFGISFRAMYISRMYTKLRKELEKFNFYQS